MDGHHRHTGPEYSNVKRLVLRDNRPAVLAGLALGVGDPMYFEPIGIKERNLTPSFPSLAPFEIGTINVVPGAS